MREAHASLLDGGDACILGGPESGRLDQLDGRVGECGGGEQSAARRGREALDARLDEGAEGGGIGTRPRSGGRRASSRAIFDRVERIAAAHSCDLHEDADARATGQCAA